MKHTPYRFPPCFAMASALLCLSSLLSAAPLEPIEGVLCRMGASEGVRRYRPGSWGVVEVYAVNHTDVEIETQAVLRFVDDPTLQYGRRVIVPPRSTLHTTTPVLVPAFPTSANIDFVTEQIDPATGESAERRSAHEALLAPQTMILDYERPAVALLGEVYPPEYLPDQPPYYKGKEFYPLAPDNAAYELVLAAKRARRLSRRVSVLLPSELPPDTATLDVVDVVVLTSDRLDPAGLSLVRNWVLGGGNLWIMLDDVSPETVQKLMGAAFRTSVVDRVRLTDFVIENVRPDVDYRGDQERHLDQPVDFVRVLPDGVTVTDQVDGWPAAFWQSFGSGRIFFTTLGPAAWMRQPAYSDPQPKTVDDHTNFFPRDPLRHFALDCIALRQTPRFDRQSLQPFLSEQIGYRILELNYVVAILGSFCAVLLLSSVWLLRRRRAEMILWTAPVAAVVTSLVFYGIGQATKRSVPPTVAAVSRVALEPGNTSGHSYGLAAIYNQRADSGQLGATRGGIFFPDMTALTGRRRRITWTDEGAWHWEELELPAGVRTAPFEVGMALEKTVDCRAHFDAAGLRGTVGPLPFAELEDALIAVPHQPAMVARIVSGGDFQVTPADVLPLQTYTSNRMLSDQQRRRTAVYARLFQQPPDPADLLPPVFFAWTHGSQLGFTFPQPNQFGSTLISIPIRFERTPAGSRVTIPAPFVSFKAVANSNGRPPTVYANRLREWAETRLAATDWLRFQMPASVLPMVIDKVKLKVHVRAPSRTVQVLSDTGAELPEVVAELQRPLGVHTVTIDEPSFLKLDSDGGLLLALRVGRDESSNRLDPMAHGTWKIESIQLEAAGTVQGN